MATKRALRNLLLVDRPMKIWIPCLVALVLSASALANVLPTPQDANVQVSMVEVWPSNTGDGRYGARIIGRFTTPSGEDLTGYLQSTGCSYLGGFVIKSGPAENGAYATLLAAVMTGKNIQIYITECGYMPVVDRVRVFP